MKKALLCVLVIPLLAFGLAHKFYVSVTNINYDKDDAAIQITSRVFIDDLERVLEERYGIDAELATDNEAEIADQYIEKYLRAKFALYLDNEIQPYAYLGKRYDNDVAIFYLELENIDLSSYQTFEIQNEVLTDLFPEQKNIVHVKWEGNKKSFVLIKENNKGMLNL